MAAPPAPNIILERDTSPPAINSVSASPSVLWPPNHQMVMVTLAVNVTDDVDPAPVTTIVDVSSNEPEDAPDDGNFAPDWEVTGDLTLRLRAERSGSGAGRTYTITVRSVDFFGNASTASTTVTVPLD
jgi:hypothetical protein